MIPNQPTVTYSLRLPEELKARMEHSAANRKLSLNQYILDILEQHYSATGYLEGSSLIVGERTLDTRVKRLAHPPGMPMCHIFLDDDSRGREVACYVLGFSSQFIWQLQIDESRQYEVIREVGQALLHALNRQGIDVTRLEWCQFPTMSNRRILQIQDAKTRTGASIRSVDQFLVALKEGLWVDRLLNARAMTAIDGLTVDAAMTLFQQNKELKMENIIEFEPSKRFAKVEEAIDEAVDKARREGCTLRFNCNDFVMLIDSSSDANSLINRYWEFKHNEGVANGTIISVPLNGNW